MSLIKRPEELEVKKTVTIGIMALPGCGKSTLALSAPKPLMLDFDNGLYRCETQYRTDSVQNCTYDDLINVLKEDLSDYDSIIIDTVGKLVQSISDSITKENPRYLQSDGSLSLKAYGVLKKRMDELFKSLYKLNKNIILVFHGVERMDENGSIVLRPDVIGSSAKDIIKDLDAIGVIEILGKRRNISFTPCSKYYAKNSLGLDDYIEIPILDGKISNNFLTEEVINPTIEKRKEEIKNAQKNNEKLEIAKNIIKNEGLTEESKKKLNDLKLNKFQVLEIKKIIKELEEN